MDVDEFSVGDVSGAVVPARARPRTCPFRALIGVGTRRFRFHLVLCGPVRGLTPSRLVEADERRAADEQGNLLRARCLSLDSPERVAAQVELGEDDEVCAGRGRLDDYLASTFRIRVDVAEAGIELG